MSQLSLLDLQPVSGLIPPDTKPIPEYPSCKLSDRSAWSFHTLKAAMLATTMAKLMSAATDCRESNPEKFKSYQAQIKNAFEQREAALRKANELAHEITPF